VRRTISLQAAKVFFSKTASTSIHRSMANNKG